MNPWNEVGEAVDTVLASGLDLENKLLGVCLMLQDIVPHYDWVGFYLTDLDREGMLVLGPYVGEPTDHEEIPFGRGICGQAAERKETFVVQDVSKEDNYLSCSPSVRSEIVVPIMHEGRVLGELDIDSHEVSPFSREEREFLERLCERIAPLLRLE